MQNCKEAGAGEPTGAILIHADYATKRTFTFKTPTELQGRRRKATTKTAKTAKFESNRFELFRLKPLQNCKGVPNLRASGL